MEAVSLIVVVMKIASKEQTAHLVALQTQHRKCKIMVVEQESIRERRINKPILTPARIIL